MSSLIKAHKTQEQPPLNNHIHVILSSRCILQTSQINRDILLPSSQSDTTAYSWSRASTCHLFPCNWRYKVGKKLAPIISAATTPALAAIPTLSNIEGNLLMIVSILNLLKSQTGRTYQKGPIKPQVDRTKLIKTPTLPASWGYVSTA